MNKRRVNTTPFDPFSIGFEDIFNKLSSGNQYGNYPPYNILKTDDNVYVIEIALAGYKESDLEVNVEKGTLTIKGSTGEDDTDYIHKGISNRSFERRFTIADTVEVNGATFENGMLRISLEKIVPETEKPKTIAINGKTRELLTEDDSDGVGNYRG